MTNSTRCALLAKQACTTLSHVVQKITPPSANNFLKLFFALFAMLALNVGNAWAEESLQVTLDFTTNSWEFPNGSSNKTATETTYTSGDYSIILAGGGSGHYFNSDGYLMLGKSGATLTLPAFDFNTTKIVVTGKSGASESVGQNIFVGNTAVSTATTGAKSTNTYAIDADYQSAGNVYILKVTTAHNTQITKIEIYGEASGGGETPGEGGGENPDSGEETSATMTAGTNGNACTVNGKDGIKVGTSSKGGDMKVTVPAGATMLHVYAAAWNNVSGLSLNITPTSNVTTTSIALTADAGIKSDSPFTLSGDEADYLFDIPLQNITAETTLTFTSSTTKRFVVWGATYETAGGDESEAEIVKTLKSIAVTPQTINYETGDVFKFDGTCTATYSVTKNGEPQDDETAVVTPTIVSTPDMSTAGTKEITVTYTEDGVTVTDTYEIHVENALPKIVITQNEVAGFTNDYAEYTWTASGVSGKIYGYKNSGMQLNSSKAGSYVYNTDPIPGYIRKIKIVKAASGTTRKWTPYVSETALTSTDGTALEQKEVETTTTWEVDGENSYFYLLEEGGATVIESITISYEAVVPQVAAPTFDPIEGTYNSVQNVTISAEEGTTIHYTLDGQNPTTESPVYSTPIEIAETKTLKAIAVKGEDVSPIASATYTINLPLTTMDQIFAKATAVDGTATPVEITFGNWVVSAVKEDGKTAFVTDGTKGFVIFDKDVNLEFSVGDILSGTAACKVQLYNGFAELTGLTSATTGLTVTTGGTITTQELDAAGIAALTGVNTGSLIKINGTCTSEDSKYYVADVQIYTSLYDFETLEVGAEYNITGIYQQYHSTKEMLPRSAEDIEEVVGLPTATISIADITMEIGQEKNIEATITPDAAQSTVQYAITSGNEYITLDGTTITAVAVGEATITATIAEKADEYKGATKEFTVTVKPQNIAVLPFTFNGGKTDIENKLGMSQEGLGSDYDNAPKLKFNSANDNVIVHFDSEPGEFSFLLKQNGQNAGTFTVYESANGEDYTPIWSGGNIGNTKSETITPTLAESSRYVKFEYTTKADGTNYALGSISIAKPDNRADAGLAWNPTSVTLTQGETFTAPTLNNPNSVSDISYESSNDEVATVTTAGVITLASGIGTATITATFDGDATYKPATATCTITVNEYIETIDGEWQLVTDASKLQIGMEIIIASVADADGTIKTMGVQNNNNRGEVSSTVSGDMLNPAVGTTIVTIEDCIIYDGLFALKTNDGYLYAAATNENQLKSQTGINEHACWTITITEGKASIVAAKSTRRNVMRYNSSSKIFSCYDENNTQQDIAIYAKVPDCTREIPVGYYGTVCLPSNIIKVLGATLYEVAGKEDNGRVVFDEVLAPEAGMPYIFLSHNAEVLFFCGDQTATEAGKHNSLQGTFNQIDPAVDNILVGNYMVVNNVIKKCGINCGLQANRAYFTTELESLGTAPALMPGRRRVTMGVTGENGTTDLDNITTTDTPVKVIENGQLIIIRDGVKYNVQGQKL